MRISLLITTYNWPRALDLVLSSVARQRRAPDEVIIADDGSSAETSQLVRAWAGKLSMPVHHVWQENKGFRAARSRNRAIAAARGDYVILLDGDMVLEEHFIGDHEKASALGWFVQGARIPTSPSGAAHLLEHGFHGVGLTTPGLRRRHQALRSPLLAQLFTRSPVPMQRIKSCNEGFWRADLIAVNGFEERIVGWGPEDKECVARLMHTGIRGKELRFAALAAHIHHPSRAPSGKNPNDDVLAATIANRTTRSQLGLDQHLAEFAQGVPESARAPWG